MKAKRRITCAKITHVSLVDKGANGKEVLWKGGDKPVHTTIVKIAKTDEEQRMVYGIVYAPEQVDSQGDIADAKVIREAAYDFMKSRFTNNVDQQHNYVNDEGFVAESWLVRKGDALFAGEPEGSWAVGIYVEKDDTWEAVKKGEITGLSMAGYAELDELDDSVDDEKVKKSILRKFSQWLGLEKDFSTDIKNEDRRRSVYTLENTLSSIWQNEELDEAAKMKAVAESIDQFKAYIVGDINKKLENDMTQEEITKSVSDAVAAAVKPLTDRIDALEKKDLTDEIKKAVDVVSVRIEALENSSSGSKLEKGQDGDKVDGKGLKLY